MEDTPTSLGDPLTEIDLTSAVDYMQRNRVGRINLTIEALRTNETASEPAHNTTEMHTGVAILEIPDHITETEAPSTLGLQGCFIQVPGNR